MNWLLDHDVPAEIGRVLSQAGHTVILVREVMPADASDQRVFEHAVGNRWVLMTCNRDDFLDLARNRRHGGLVILIRRRTRIDECAHVIRLLHRAGETGITDNINFA